jgi:predicted  nucleic acid-binding Zn-ribbon protein
MLNTASKVDAILEAWLKFIHLEDLSNAKVPSNEAERNGIRLTSNTILIEENLFSKLQQTNTFGSRGQKDTAWVLSFPQIYKVDTGKSNLCPLFTLDVTAIFRGGYQTEGWNVENFDMAEAGENLVAFLNLDEEQLEQLNVKDGLRQFLELTFGFNFESLEDWMQQVNLPQYRITRQPYLFKFKSSRFTLNLKQDLKAIKESQKEHWLKSGHPAYEYLFGIPQLPTHEISYLGAFLTHPPTDSQLKAIKHAQSEPLTAVQGPPGSGKTTLILNLIAQQVVDRALRLIETGEDTNNLTVVSSTNNRAVENVLERLSKDLPDSFFHLNGGNKTVIAQIGGAKEQLQQALDYLHKSNFNENQYCSLASQIQHIKQCFVSQERQYQELWRRRQADETRQPEAEQELRSLQQQFADRYTAKDQLEQREATIASYDQLPENAYRQIRSQFNSVGLELPKRTPSWWIRWLYWLLGRTERQVLAKMSRRCQTAIDQTLGTPFEIDFPLDRRALHRQSQKIDAGLDQLQELRTVRDDLRHLAEELVRLNQECEEKQIELTEIEERLAIPIVDYYSTFHTQYHEQHKELFNLSRQFLTQEAFRRKSVIETDLRFYLKTLAEPSKVVKPKAEQLNERLKSVSLIFPVITCTLQSIRNMLPWTASCVDRVIVDESGMIPLHQTFPLLVRTRKAIVVGDPLQIEPIVNQTQQTIERYIQEAFSDRGLTQEDYCRYSPAEIDRATTYHRAAGATGEDNDPGQGIRLLEHYRCQPNIIDYCDRIANYGLIPKKELKASLIGANLVAYHVNGNISTNVNQEEIRTIHEVIRHLVKYGYSLEEIGVISAFRAQANALRESLSKEFPQLKNAIGTIHTFQGSERRVIILSTKVCRRQDSVRWINRRPNLLNVAVSRAKELFILVGNLHLLEEAGDYTRQLVEHIREQGIILEYKTTIEVAPEYRSSPGNSWIYDCDHLEILAEALRDAEQELYVIAPEIRGKAAQKFSQDVVAALKRDVNVTVIYGFPNNSNENEEETSDEKKLKTLFNKYKGARIFHLKGQGTNERILICDRKFAVVGSWNWLSHIYLPACQKQQVTEEVQITRETSLRVAEPGAIQSKREEIIELIKNLT